MPRRILIADDEASIRRAVRAFIESRSQFEVCEATGPVLLFWMLGTHMRLKLLVALPFVLVFYFS
jgi:hypothetical protein